MAKTECSMGEETKWWQSHLVECHTVVTMSQLELPVSTWRYICVYTHTHTVTKKAKQHKTK